MHLPCTLVLILVTCAALACTGCTQPVSPVTISPGTGPAAITDLAQFALQPSDLPPGFTLAETRMKTPSEMSRLARDLGWQAGYVARYVHPAQAGSTKYEIMHSIAIYPAGRIPDVIEYSDKQARSDRTITYTDYPVQGLGDNARAFSGTGVQIPLNTTGVTARITGSAYVPEKEADAITDFAEVIFAKGDVFEVIRITGSSPDPAILVNLSRQAYAKIP